MRCCLLSTPESLAVSLVCDHAVAPSGLRSPSPKNTEAGISMAMSCGSPQERHFYASVDIKHYAPQCKAFSYTDGTHRDMDNLSCSRPYVVHM